MAKKTGKKEGKPAQAPPTIHEATRATDGSGAVIKAAEIDEASAVDSRNTGRDIVVCGEDEKANRKQASDIETAVGPWLRQQKHKYSAGPQALPHFQQKTPPPNGHSFYETGKAKARKQK